MRLDELITLVEQSTPEQWSLRQVEEVYKWEQGTEKGFPYLKPITFSEVAIFREDVDIALLLSASLGPFTEKWVEAFFNKSALKQISALRYRGCIVWEWYQVKVDGYRLVLPMPEIDDNGKFHVSQT